MKVKICGLTREDDIKFVNEAQPDYIGFVFAPSRRQIDFIKAEKLKKFLASSITSVGVFVNEKIENIVALVDSGIIDMIQLHGEESTEYIIRLKEQTNVKIIKMFLNERGRGISETVADYIGFDSGAGSGKTLNWSCCHKTAQPLFLAGGLDETNVELASRIVSPFAVDVSSGVENNGVKDKNKILNFVKLVRNL